MLETIQRALAELEETRRHIDEDIADLRRILERHRGQVSTPSATTKRKPKARRRGSRPGAAQREVLKILGDGEVWRPHEIAKRRGSSANAVNAALRRLVNDGAVSQVGTGRYKLASQNGDAPEPPADVLSDWGLSATGGDTDA